MDTPEFKLEYRMWHEDIGWDEWKFSRSYSSEKARGVGFADLIKCKRGGKFEYRIPLNEGTLS